MDKDMISFKVGDRVILKFPLSWGEKHGSKFLSYSLRNYSWEIIRIYKATNGQEIANCVIDNTMYPEIVGRLGIGYPTYRLSFFSPYPKIKVIRK